ncbi:lysyl oxidase homolog 2-like [Leguminivora glycinivorella]|uniref:lysyl oxidase homolog 2-like n=1 Tax=Leguminivora glycinivorella TaxID=1035111 RepID=UPI002010C199|nr:lysyl oxidase homolog 2-like [Leguminivora glycinivorella]
MDLAVKYFITVVLLVEVTSRDLNETDRAARAAFVQKLLNKQRLAEGRLSCLVVLTNLKATCIFTTVAAGEQSVIIPGTTQQLRSSAVVGIGVEWPLMPRSMEKLNVSHIQPYYSLEAAGATYGKFWMDDVVCEGTETSLNHCIFSGWGSSDCEPSEAAGAICSETPVALVKTARRSLMETLEADARLRLVGGKRDNEGRVETLYQETRATLEHSDAAGAICRETPVALAKPARRNLMETLEADVSLRMVGGKKYNEGRVEIYYKGEWGSVCADGWSFYEAIPVCHHLGLGFAAQASQTNVFGASKIVLSGVQCKGNEKSLFECSHEDIGEVKCPGGVDSKTNPAWQYETRRLLRFTAASLNIGNDEFRPYLPKHLWQWHLCHMHYHSMEVFATFDVLNATGHRVAEGHKASFCLEDNTCLPGVDKNYSCKNYGDQGISVNCSDIYMYNIDCQWVDVTDVELGDYTFKVAVNPHARIAEQQFHNNAATCVLRLSETYASVYGCTLGRP